MRYRLLGLFLFWLLTDSPLLACAVCRPRVQAGIHNGAYAVNLLLVLLPVAVLLLGGLAVFFAADLRLRLLSFRA